MTVDLAPTLDLALRLHPGTRRVFVVAGRSKTDSYWVEEARRAFRGHEGRVEFVYLTGLPLERPLAAGRRLCRTGASSTISTSSRTVSGTRSSRRTSRAHLASAANAPVYGHYSTYVGRGIVGGRVVSFEAEGANAARIAVRILAGETPESVGPARGDGKPLLVRLAAADAVGHRRGATAARQRRPEQAAEPLGSLPVAGSSAASSLSVVEALLIVALLLERMSRRRAEGVLRSSQSELRALTGRLLQAQETERRRIAGELHDDLNQSLALLAVELDLLAQSPPGTGAPLDGRVRELSGRVKQLSSAVHDLSHQLHPTKLEQLGLVAALRGLCGELGPAHGLGIDFAAEGVPTSIPGDTALCLYRIAQEALRNVIKHSGARHAAGRAARGPGRGLRSRLRRRVRVRPRVGRRQGGARPGQHAGAAAPGRRRDRDRLPAVGRCADRRPHPAGRVRPPTGEEEASHRQPDGCIMNAIGASMPREVAMRRPRVLLADDHRLVREAFARLLESECDVVGAVADGRALLEAAPDLRPDIVVLDIAMPLLNGLDAARQLRRLMPEVKLIFLTVSEDPDLAAEAFRAGASGYLLKNSAASELLKSIQEVSQGRSYVTPLATQGLVGFLPPRPRAGAGDGASERPTA